MRNPASSEFLAALTTFATMAYIIVVNPQILSQSGMDFNSVMIATIVVAAFSTLLMGFYANYPFALAPGMGINAYFTYGIVLGAGFSWQAALGLCLISGILVLLLNLLGLREKLLNAIPYSLRLATTAGIGLFLLFIGFQNIALISYHQETLLTLGDPTTTPIILAALGIIIAGALMSLGLHAALLISMIFISLLAWFFGLAPWIGIAALPTLASDTFLQLDFYAALQPSAWPIIMTLVFIALFDAAGTVLALSEQGTFMKEKKVPRLKAIFFCDAVGTIAGGVLGSSPVTTYFESAAGINAGGRRGLTALFIALLFLLALFFTPLITSIPLFATAPALIIIGGLMIKSAAKIEWDIPTEAIPACITLAAIPLTYSIADGIALGFITYPCMKLLSGRIKETNLTLWVIAALFALKFSYL